jgi:DNA modification methylase
MNTKMKTANDGNIVFRSPGELKPYEGNARLHDEKQIVAIMASIKEFGFTVAIIANEEGMVLAGHGRLEAAKRLGLATVPVRVVTGLTAKQQKAYVLADNKIAQMSKWDKPKLQAEIEMLMAEDFNIEVTGFSTAEIDLMIDSLPAPEENDPGDLQPEDLAEETPVSKPGDLFQLGVHRLYCGSALEKACYALLMEGHMARQCLTDPPYNVAIDGHVCGSGKKKHDEFKMASGEMSESEFTAFLGKSFSLVEEFSDDGAIIMSFMDWRHQREILDAAEPIFGSIKQLCVWVKDNGGMGTFYRSQHELVYVFKKGKAPHVNNFGLGENGRYRTNVWSYPGVNTFKGKGYELLKLHPTVKPVSMIADAIRDCSHRKDVILDPFSGSGTILIACERTGRYARAIELDPKYVDVAVRRWERFTGEAAVHTESGLTFQELSDLRNAEDSHVGG